MIYLFSCCQNLADCPAKCLTACQDSACGRIFGDLLNRPLGGFVFMAFWLGILELTICIYVAFSPEYQDKLTSCRFIGKGASIGIHNWLMVQAGFAALNVLFAPYLQWRMWLELNEEAREPDDPSQPMDNRTRLAQTDHGPVRASKQDVREAFKQVFLYDIGVLLYVLALAASFAWSYYGMTWIQEADDTPEGFNACNPDDPTLGVSLPSFAAWSGAAFVAFVVLYGMGWYCMMACMDSQETLTLRHGVAAAAAVSAAAGRPIPGMGGLAGLGMGPGRQQGEYGRVGQGQGNYARSGSRKDYSSGPGPAYQAGAKYSNAPNAPPYEYQPPPKSFVKSFAKLLACLGLDLMGNASYFIPAAGEVTDVVFAPASAVALKMMFNSNAIALIGLAEELGPYTDILPTATIAWFLETCAPDHPLTRCLGVRPEWSMTGDWQR